jgi:CspA family cold shock protein
MFNTKNLIILIISGLLAAFITQATSLTELSALLLSSFLAVILMLIGQSIRAEPVSKFFSTRKAAKASRAASKKSTSSPSDPNRESGTVKWFDSNKGYGFITRSMGEDIFVHFRSIKGNGYRSLYEGQSVEFLVTKGSKGPQAEDIKIVS